MLLKVSLDDKWSSDVKYNSDNLPDTLKMNIKTYDRSLRILCDVLTEDTTFTRKASIYTKYFISNCSGIDLLFADKDKNILSMQSPPNEIIDDNIEQYPQLYNIEDKAESCDDGYLRIGDESDWLFYGGSSKLRLQIGGYSKWSSAFPLTVTNGGVVNYEADDGKVYTFSVVVSTGPGKVLIIFTITLVF